MLALVRLKSVQWMLPAVFALTSTAVLAQQPPDKSEAAQPKTEETQTRTEAAPAKSEPSPKPAEESQAKTEEDPKLISVPGGKALGMSILGNQEAPKALVIVPWKTSELGNTPGISTMLDDSRLPIDKEVFMRMLSYYETRSESTRPGGAPAEKNGGQPSAVPQRRNQ